MPNSVNLFIIHFVWFYIIYIYIYIYSYIFVILTCTFVPFLSLAPGDFLSSLSTSAITLTRTSPSINVTFPIVDDSIFEPNENLFGIITLPAGVINSQLRLEPARTEITIIDDDRKFSFS